MATNEHAHQHHVELDVALQNIPTYAVKFDDFEAGVKPETSRWAFKSGYLIRLKVIDVDPVSYHVLDIGRVNSKGIGQRIFRCAHCDYRGKAPQTIEAHWHRHHEDSRPSPEAIWYDDETCGGFDKRPVEVRKAIYAATANRRAVHRPQKRKRATSASPGRDLNPAAKAQTPVDWSDEEKVASPRSANDATYEFDSQPFRLDVQPPRPQFNGWDNSRALTWSDTNPPFAAETQASSYSPKSPSFPFRPSHDFDPPGYDSNTYWGQQKLDFVNVRSGHSSSSPLTLVESDRSNPYMRSPASFRNEFERYTQISDNFDMGRRYPLGWSNESDGLLATPGLSIGSSQSGQPSQEFNQQPLKAGVALSKPQQHQAFATGALPNPGWSFLNIMPQTKLADLRKQHKVSQQVDAFPAFNRYRPNAQLSQFDQLHQHVRIETDEQHHRDAQFEQTKHAEEESHFQQNEQSRQVSLEEMQTGWESFPTESWPDLSFEGYLFSEQEMKELDDHLQGVDFEAPYTALTG